MHRAPHLQRARRDNAAADGPLEVVCVPLDGEVGERDFVGEPLDDGGDAEVVR